VLRKRWVSGFAVGVSFALLAVACSSNSTPSAQSASGTPTKGGTYRTATQTLSNTSNFDPTGEYYGYAWALFQNMLIRGLYNYNHVAGQPGDVPQPDLATETNVSDDGLTYTFTIRDDVKWGPPLDRNVTTADIEYAFERINDQNLAAYYGNYYCGVIKGMTCTETDIKPVSGIEVPDDTHIVFHLENPTGDFLYRVALPASYPQPKEVAGCFTTAGEYGTNLVSSGAYMYFGADKVDASSCNTIKAIAGINPEKGITIVRNPNFDPATEDAAMYSNYLDGLQVSIDSNVDDIFSKIQAGELDGSFADTPPATVEQTYATDPNLQQYIHSDTGDRTWYITMNLLTPPFDDPHVRKAVQYVVDKAALVKGYGGSLHADPATTVTPPTVLPAIADYNPYPSENFAGDANAAMEEMKQATKYDTNGDGQCDAPECSFLLLASNTQPWRNMNPILVQDLAKIGLEAQLKEVAPDVVNSKTVTVKNLVPMSFGQGWGKDYGSPYGFSYFVMDGDTISCTGSYDQGLLGMDADQAKECGVEAEYNAALQYYPDGKLPSIDDKLQECVALSGDQQQTCYADMEKVMMEQGMTWVPWSWGKNLIITSPSVTQYVYDQNAGDPAWAHIAVNNNKQPENVA
jgi:peptide/nickel transport system substrate-binding protein